MITKGGLNTVTRHLAIEYAKQGIRFNAVAPGVVNTALHQENSRDHPITRQPLGDIAEISDIFNAVLYLANARQFTGEVSTLTAVRTVVVGSAKDEQRRERSEPAFEVQASVSLVRNLPQVPGNLDPCEWRWPVFRAWTVLRKHTNNCSRLAKSPRN